MLKTVALLNTVEEIVIITNLVDLFSLLTS